MKPMTDNSGALTYRLRHDRPANVMARGRIRNPLVCQPELSSMTRAYLRELRAAEMTAWELSGGDYLISVEG